MDTQYTPATTRIPKRLSVRIPFYICGLLLCVASALYYLSFALNKSPLNFPVGIDIIIEEGTSQKAITQLLSEKNVVQSALLLQLQLERHFKDTFIQAGVYRFTEPLNSMDVAKMLTKGLNRSPEIKITLPEGFKANELYQYVPEKFAHGDRRDLTSYEGYLFPDTYFITSDMTLNEILIMLTKTADEKLKPYDQKISASGFSKNEVIILASIIEREAKDTESKKMVSGILQNRLRINMPLQVDATFDYILNKASHELTDDDLEIESPFNSYNNPGLPPTPIANPGIKSIEAVLDPAESDYLYYLTGDDGTFYYAKTFEEHKRNKERYLRTF